MLRDYEQQIAVNLLIYFLVCLVLHVVGVFPRDTVNNNLLRELNSKSIFVYSNLFDIVATPDFDSGFCDKMLDDNISH
jgi:hypothetical protein